MLKKSGKMLAVLMAASIVASPLGIAAPVYADELISITDETAPAEELSRDVVEEVLLEDDADADLQGISGEESVPDADEEPDDIEVDGDPVFAVEPVAPETNGRVLSFFDKNNNVFKANQHIFFGQKNGYFIYDDYPNKDIPRWRILHPERANNGYNPEDGTPGYIFVMSEKLWGYEPESENMDHYPGNIPFGSDKVYQGSQVQNIITDFWDPNEGVESVFSEEEIKAVKGFQKQQTQDEEISQFTTSKLVENDKVFLMSLKEMKDYVSNASMSADPKRMANYKDKQADEDNDKGPKRYWLRSPAEDYIGVAEVQKDGSVAMSSVSDTLRACIRPAFNIDQSKIMFVSAAVNGKLSGTVGGGALKAVKTDNVTEWKLTLKASDREGFDATRNDGSSKVKAGGKIGIHFSGAKEGTNEYVSAVLCDSTGKNILYYGRIANNKKTGDISVTIPSGLNSGKYVLKVFSEQYNDNRYTDYASTPVDIDLEVEGAKAQTITTSANEYTKNVGDAAFNLGAKALGGAKLTYKSSNSSVVTVDTKGLVTIKGAGTASITISAAATAEYKAAAKTVKITVKNGIDISKATVSGIKNKVYTGKIHSQSPTVKLGGVKLVRGTDYKITYKKDTDRINVGTVKFTIKGIGKYTNSITKSFKIIKAKNTLEIKPKKEKLVVRSSWIKNKDKTIGPKAAYTIKAKNGKLTYEKKKGHRKITIAKNGKVTVKKGLKKGNYTVRVGVTAKGDKNHKAGKKYVKLMIVVK